LEKYGDAGDDKFGVRVKPLPIFEDPKVRQIGDSYLLPIPDVD
tara:strand:+ start:84496 stop:84624 length:129 start_codon:yes stop_codon:yes gene_type:complete